jgi:hypothetical protein
LAADFSGIEIEVFFDDAQLLQKVTELWNEVMIGNMPEVCRKVIAVILQALQIPFKRLQLLI